MKIAYTVAEYCEAMGIKNSYRVYQAIERGDIPYFYAPGTKRGKRIPAQWVEEQIEKQLCEHGDARTVTCSKSASQSYKPQNRIARDRAALAGGGNDPHRSIQ